MDFEPIPAYIFQELDRHEHVYSSFQYETCNLEHFACSRCGASDRDRLYALYLRGVLSTNARVSVLDIAPSAPLTGFLRQFNSAHVRSADLQMSGVDDKIDITDMSTYADGQFDGFICSHVLEHIPNDVAAMKELHRVLRPGGWGIAMVPIHLGLERVHEDPSITDEAGRWKYFASTTTSGSTPSRPSSTGSNQWGLLSSSWGARISATIYSRATEYTRGPCCMSSRNSPTVGSGVGPVSAERFDRLRCY